VEGIGLLLALLALDDDGVAGVVSAGASGANVCISSEDIDKFALALVTPLGAEAVSLGHSHTWRGRRGKPTRR